MGRSRRKKPFYEQVEITDIGAEGKALARVNDKVVFTTHVIPGDVVDLQVRLHRQKGKWTYQNHSQDSEPPIPEG